MKGGKDMQDVAHEGETARLPQQQDQHKVGEHQEVPCHSPHVEVCEPPVEQQKNYCNTV